MLLFFPSRPCFFQCRSLMVHVTKGEFQAQNKRTLHTCLRSPSMVLIWFTESSSGLFIMLFAIVFLNNYLSLSASLSPLPTIFAGNWLTFFSLFGHNSDDPEKHLTCRSWTLPSSQNIIKNRQKGTDLWGILGLHLMWLEILDFNKKWHWEKREDGSSSDFLY